MVVMMLTSIVILLLTSTAFFIYEVVEFKRTSVNNLTTIGKIIATNSTAALAFDSQEDAMDILRALKAETHIVAAGIYASDSTKFASYPKTISTKLLPDIPGDTGFYFEQKALKGFLPIKEGNKQLGILYLHSDLDAIYDRVTSYIGIAVIFILTALVIAYFLAQRLYRGITKPIFKLTVAAKAISEEKDYSVRVTKFNDDELGILTDSFNIMLAEIESFNEVLENKVNERTRELALANKELESFSYSISHDLRAPLRTAHGFMEIFSEDYVQQMDDEAKRIMEKVMGSTRKMTFLIDDILEFSRLGRQELNKSMISMNELVMEVWNEQTFDVGNRIIKLDKKDLPDVLGDRKTLKQVWANLISNAIKYSRQKEIAAIQIGAKVQNQMVIYYIKDNGAGFSMDYYSKLFGVFQRLHNDREFEGTGAGLAIAQRILKKHGGDIWAEAEPGNGATFFFVVENKNQELAHISILEHTDNDRI